MATPGRIPPPYETVVSPSPNDWDAYYCGAGDQLSPLVRGGGTEMVLDFTGPDVKVIQVRFAEPVEILDGEGHWDIGAFDATDKLSMTAVLDATPAVANPGNGAAQEVPVGPYSIYVPAAGDGSHDIDLTTAVPVPTLDKDGYWDVDYSTGEITPAANPGSAGFHLLNVPVQSRFLVNIPMGNPRGVFEVDNYRVKWLHQNWHLDITVDKSSAGAGKFSAWLLVFRENTD